MMTKIYEQEHNSMVNIIEDARRSLAMTVDELHDEQQVLSQTSDKLSESVATSGWSSLMSCVY